MRGKKDRDEGELTNSGVDPREYRKNKRRRSV
jgi:hypothetical protein